MQTASLLMELCTDSMRVVKSQLSHCLSLFEAMCEAGRPYRLTDLAARLDMPKSSVQRLLDHLIAEGWAEQDAATGHYALTLRLAVLGQRYMQSAGLCDVTQAILGRVAGATGELARLAIVDQRQLVWIGSAQGAPAGLLYQPSMGQRIVSFATANGKAWLSTLDDEEASAIALRDGLTRRRAPLGPKAIGSLDALMKDLAAVRRRGYALADEEAESGVAAVAVPIRDPATGEALGTTSVAGPVMRFTATRRAQFARILAAAALELAQVWPLRDRHAPHSARQGAR